MSLKTSAVSWMSLEDNFWSFNKITNPSVYDLFHFAAVSLSGGMPTTLSVGRNLLSSEEEIMMLRYMLMSPQ